MAPTVVLLHAFPLDARLWDDVVDAVAGAGWDVVVPDLRGFGESAYGEDGPDDEPSLVWMARDVLGILDRVGVNSAVVVGLSLGGYVAMELVRQDASRIAGLALVDTKASADTEEARANRLRVAEQVLEAGSTTALARAMLPGLLGATTLAARPEVVERVRGWIEDADPAGVAWAQRAMAARPDSHDDLAGARRARARAVGCRGHPRAPRRAGVDGRGAARRALRRDPRVRAPQRGGGAGGRRRRARRLPGRRTTAAAVHVDRRDVLTLR